MRMGELHRILLEEPPVGPFCCIICMQRDGYHKMDCPLRGLPGASRDTWFQDVRE